MAVVNRCTAERTQSHVSELRSPIQHFYLFLAEYELINTDWGNWRDGGESFVGRFNAF